VSTDALHKYILCIHDYVDILYYIHFIVALSYFIPPSLPSPSFALSLSSSLSPFSSSPSENSGTKKHDCVAYYVSYAKGVKGMRTAKIEYFDDKGLENFFLNRPKENNGIVQKFEDPTSPYNTVLRAYWTPHKLQLQQVKILKIHAFPLKLL
jgi:hypothetical protein